LNSIGRFNKTQPSYTSRTFLSQPSFPLKANSQNQIAKFQTTCQTAISRELPLEKWESGAFAKWSCSTRKIKFRRKIEAHLEAAQKPSLPRIPISLADQNRNDFACPKGLPAPPQKELFLGI
jgi:hypothetical protein